MNVEMRDIKSVTPYARNPRKNDKAIAKTKASIQEFGWRQPIVVDEQGTIVVGHTRHAAALEMGLVEVPVHVAEGLTEAQIKAYRLADNRTGQEAEWDFEMLGLELLDLSVKDFDLELTGFSPEELDQYLSDDGEGGGGDGGDPDDSSGNLSDRFMLPPFSVLNAREGWWQDRKRAWVALGIQSELGRGAPIGGAPMPLDRAKGGNAIPGGSLMPAANYSQTKARGDGRGREI